MAFAMVTPVASTTLREQIFRAAMEKDVPFRVRGRLHVRRNLGSATKSRACSARTIFGRHAQPWEPHEIKKLTAVNRECVLEGARKAWPALAAARPRPKVAGARYRRLP